MNKLIKIKRGLDLQRQIYLMPEGELVWTTDRKELWIGDGNTSGGIKITASAESNYVHVNQLAQPNGVATLDVDGTIPVDQIPHLAISEVFVVNNEQEQLSLPAQSGDVAVRLDNNQNYIHNGGNTSSMLDWTALAINDSDVISVNGDVGAVKIGIFNLDDTTIVDVQPDELLQWDGNQWINVDPSTVGRTTFTALNDTPADYINSADMIVKVNTTGTAVEFTNIIDGGLYTGVND